MLLISSTILISINSLVNHLRCTVSFSNTSCLLQALSLKRPLEIGKMHDGLYFLCSDCLQKNSHAQHHSFSLYPLSSDKVQCTLLSCKSHSNAINSSFVVIKTMLLTTLLVLISFLMIVWICCGIIDLVMYPL